MNKLIVSKLSYKKMIRDLSFSVKQGECIAIVGPNGAGKSTLLKLIAKEINIKEEKIIWKQKAINKYTTKNLAHECVFMRQHHHLNLAFTLEQVVMMGRYPYFKTYPSFGDKQVVGEAIREMALTFLKHKPSEELSGGEQQRMHFARCLSQLDFKNSSHPKLFLLDEPLNNLDIKYQHLCMRLIKELTQKGHVALVVLHDLNMASFYADKIMILKNGKLLSFKSPAESIKKDVLEECFCICATILNHPVNHQPFVYFQ